MMRRSGPTANKTGKTNRRIALSRRLLPAAAALSVALAAGAPVRATEPGSPTRPPDEAERIAHGKSLFISYGCGWCHEDGGRKAGKCPQLMDTARDDDFILTRIAVGSPGKMPSFGEALKEADFHDLLRYIRSLKPETKP